MEISETFSITRLYKNNLLEIMTIEISRISDTIISKFCKESWPGITMWNIISAIRIFIYEWQRG